MSGIRVYDGYTRYEYLYDGYTRYQYLYDGYTRCRYTSAVFAVHL